MRSKFGLTCMRTLVALAATLASAALQAEEGGEHARVVLATDAGVRFTIHERHGLAAIHVGSEPLARGHVRLENVDPRLDLVEQDAVELDRIETSELVQASPKRATLTHRTPDADIRYEYHVSGDDLKIAMHLTHRHAGETLDAVRLKPMQWYYDPDASIRASGPGWSEGYVFHPANHRGTFLQGDGRVGRREMLLTADGELGVSASPMIVEEQIYPRFLINHVNAGRETVGDRRMNRRISWYMVRINAEPGETVSLGFQMRIVPEDASWVKLIEPYRLFWRRVRTQRAERKAESEAIKRLKAQGAPAGALDTVRQTEMFERELAKRLPAAERDTRGYLSALLPSVKIGWYPSYDRLVIPMDLGQLERKFDSQLKALHVQVRCEEGNVVARETIALTGDALDAHRRGRLHVSLPDLPEGRYRATATIEGYDQPWEKEFRWKRFEWAGNELGNIDNVPAPFEPIEREGNAIRTVFREYKLGGLGMPTSVVADGEELLAGPIALIADGETPLEGEGGFTATSSQRTEFAGGADHPAVNIKTRIVTDYDGCMKVELTLLPTDQQRELGSLHLDIPLKDSMATLWHATTSGLRSNPYGSTPDGEGVVWTSQRMWSDQRPRRQGKLLTNIKPYVWLGKDERGLAWFADNDKGWVLDLADDKGELHQPQHQPPAQELIRKDGQVILRVRFVQRPITLTEPREITFGLMATPAKPMPENWRKWTTTTHNIPKDYRYITWMMQYWGSDTNWANRYPRNRDLSVLDKMAAVRRGEEIDVDAYMEKFEERNYGEGMRDGWKPKEQVLGLVRLMVGPGGWMRHGPWRDRNNFGFAYYEELINCNPLHEEFQVYRDEWTGAQGGGVAISGLVGSYRDFGVWYGREFLKRGFGLYFDNAFPERDHDPLTTAAYHLREADPRLRSDGEKIQPSVRMWHLRDYLRRHWIVSRTHGSETFPVGTYVHMTNTDIAPWLVWADVILDMEYPLYNAPRQKWFKPDMLRAACFGRRTGSVPTAMTHIGGPGHGMTVDELDRTRFGVLMVHEIRPTFVSGHHEGNKAKASRRLYKRLVDLGYGRDDATVWNYWHDDYPVTVSDAKVKSLLFRHDNELVLLLCSWNEDATQVDIQLDTNAIDVNPTIAEDAENTPTQWSVSEGRFELSMKPYGVTMIRMRPAVADTP